MEPAYDRPLKNFFSRRNLLNTLLFYTQNNNSLTKGEEHPHKEHPEDVRQMNTFVSFFK